MNGQARYRGELLALVQQACDAELFPSWQRLLARTREHFGQEDRCMTATRFAASNCHTLQHKVVLAVMAEGEVQASGGDPAALRSMASELALWFLKHAQSMDAALALHLRRVGYHAETGLVRCPDSLPASLIQGCASQACSGANAQPA